MSIPSTCRANVTMTSGRPMHQAHAILETILAGIIAGQRSKRISRILTRNTYVFMSDGDVFLFFFSFFFSPFFSRVSIRHGETLSPDLRDRLDGGDSWTLRIFPGVVLGWKIFIESNAGLVDRFDRLIAARLD